MGRIRTAVRDEFIAASLKELGDGRDDVHDHPVRDEFIAASLKDLLGEATFPEAVRLSAMNSSRPH